MTSEISQEQAHQLPSSNNFRRSVSIFSRKGTESPVHTTQALVISGNSMVFGTPSPTGSSSMGRAKSKRWTLSGRVDVPLPTGTILRAVPKDAHVPKSTMTPLEREMATSPNEEILRAIGLTPESAPTSPIESPSSPLGDMTNVTPRRYYSKRGKKNSQEDYLGVWRNGEVSWGQENASTSNRSSPAPKRPSLAARPKTSDGTPKLAPNGLQVKSKLTKPRIQVIIPENHSAKRPFSFMPFRQNSSQSITSIASADISPPSVTSGLSIGSAHVSAISPPTIQRPKPQRAFQPITIAIDESLAFEGDFLDAERPPHSRTTSVNSSNSDSDGDDNSVARSSRSSMTSIGIHNDESQVRKGESLSRQNSSSSEASFTANDDASGMNNKPVSGPRMNDMIGMIRTSSTSSRTASGRRKRLSSSRGQQLLAKINSREELKLHSEETTPTLDDAVKDLENSLSGFQYDTDGADAPEVVEAPIVATTTTSSVPDIRLSPVESPPALPRKSSRRARLSFPPQEAIVEAPTSPPTPKIANPYRASAPPSISAETFAITMEANRLAERTQQQYAMKRERRESYGKLRRMSSVRSVLSLVKEEDEFPSVESNAAEEVVYHILSQLTSMDDLFNAALITKGFHHIFKQNEAELMRNALQKECAPAWEYRESCLGAEEDEDNSAAPSPEWTPHTYFQGYKADMEIVYTIKELILQECSTLLTADTLNALRTGYAPRVDAALFRIWTFCKIFGSNKGREDDVVAQMDWLRGGLIAHQDTCTSTISNHDSFYISNVLLSAPEHFARGNEGGLSAENLYDMLEMWNCLAKLTRGMVGKTDQARQFGIFDETDVGGGDIDGEEAMLEEWQAYILTLGLTPVLEIASALVSDGSHAAFAVAQYNRLTFWDAPLVGSSRSSFLHEAVSRLYEERICEAFSPEDVQMKEMRSLRRNRDSEFRQRRLSTRSMQPPERSSSLRLSREWGSFRSAEGPSTVSRRTSVASSGLGRSASVRVPARPTFQQTNSHMSSAIRRSYYPVAETIAEEQLPVYDAAAERERERARMHPLQLAMQRENDDPSQNSADKAVMRIMEMGFTPDEAKGALKITDMGDGLRVDRAVEYLMRSKGYA